MIHLVTKTHLRTLETAARTAQEQAGQVRTEIERERGRHVKELFAAVARTERAERETADVRHTALLLQIALEDATVELTERAERAETAAFAAHWDEEVARAEARLLREELSEARKPGRSVYLLRHYGEPCMIYRSRADACADTATHGIPADAPWAAAGEQPASQAEWRLSLFTYDAASKGFRCEFVPAPVAVGGAA
ncbi:hypothetical protein [Streptomyces alboflavus]|uniref:hypothetical protein n=1 Tax=Streptomyces alboflavus TaxID=67267 RepID=UPI000F658DBD|nr:hypothetical protein [Streptomyces alboflavus]